MSAFEVYQFHDSRNNTIKYLFNPNKRDNDGEGPVILDQLIETFDDEKISSTTISEPKPGTILFQYMARDGGDVRYLFDPTARNGRQYVVAIHRPPENWKTMREEDLAVEDEAGLRRQLEERDNSIEAHWRTEGRKRRDSALEGPLFDDMRMDVDAE